MQRNNSRVSRGEAILQQFVNEGKMTSSGKDWLIAALDPAHDDPIPNNGCGFPDMTTGHSVVRLVKQSINVSAPTNLAPNALWDCHVIQWPWHRTVPFGKCVSGNNAIAIDPSPPASLGGLQAFAQPTGEQLDYTYFDFKNTIEVDSAYLTSSSRVIALGFEVENTTADMYRQGNVLTYRLDQPMHKVQPFSATVTTEVPTNGCVGLVNVSSPPLDQPTAQLIPGSRTWRASEGCYSVSTFNSFVNPSDGPVFVNPYILDGNIAAAPYQGLTGYAPVASSGSSSTAGFPAMHISPLNLSGAYFTGLSQQSTLEITQYAYIETFPDVSDPGILVLASPAPQYDPLAMQIYSNAIRRLPVSTLFRDNPFGEWFFETVSEISSFLAPILSMIPHPVAQAGATLANAANSFATSRKKKPAATAQPLGPPMRNRSKPLPPIPQKTKPKPLPPIPQRRSKL